MMDGRADVYFYGRDVRDDFLAIDTIFIPYHCPHLILYSFRYF